MLRVPQAVTRPTSSRVKEAIFSTLTHELGSFSNLHVLDLYAGSGALGIEAVSRGASAAVFVDNDRTAVSVINSNLSGLGKAQTKVVKSNVATYLGQESTTGSYDVVFMDPPYSVVDAVVEDHITSLVDKHWLSDDAVVVVEREANSAIDWPEGFEALEPRNYGDTAVWYGRYVGNSASSSEGSES